MGFLKVCVDDNKGVVALEAKVDVVLLQKIPPGRCPYFVVASLTQTINENKYWVSAILNACVADT